MSTSELKLILTTIVAPAIALLVPLCVRTAKGAPQSTATDIFAALFVLDVAIVADYDRFGVLMQGALKDNLPVMASLAIAVDIVFWMAGQLAFDHSILKHHERKVVRNAVSAYNSTLPAQEHVEFDVANESDWVFLWLALQWLFSWSVCLTLIVAHVVLLSGGHYPWH